MHLQRHHFRFALLALILSVTNWASAEVVTLYDDGLGNLPGDQPWLGYFALGGIASESAIAQGVRLQSDQSSSAGYSNHSPTSNPISPQILNPGFPSLLDTNGYSLTFQLQLLNESHTSNDRAGFSVIALGNDGRGIELGFWEDRIFAQNDTPLFTHGEEALFDTTAMEANYLLTIQNGGYTLAADSQQILSGALRDYSGFNGTPLGVPYTLTNYLFLGDDTSSASVDARLGSLVLNSNLTAVPEPGVFVSLLIFFYLMTCSPRRKRVGCATSR